MAVCRSWCVWVLLCAVGLPMPARAVEPAPEEAKVMMLGVFHFANPGRDMVKSKVIDVTTADNQAYLAALATRLAAFQPTDVLIECERSAQPRHDAAYAAYRDDGAALDVNETHQIGFRVAREAGLGGVTCFDEGEVQWKGGALFDYIAAHDPDLKAALDAELASLSARETREQTTLPLPELLRLANNPERERENKDLYLETNDVDAGGGFVGADASASWWHRNFRMYANVQQAAAPGRRVLVIAGSGHTAILKDLLAIDGQRQAEDVVPYLMP
ncbi:hypothetical protein CSC70_12770 [Pseudoxanthomonas kalamensis DSM 18571]|uniref:DUF5694 domain-containing protein n=1 Tax=Pseudoxanthomonas kalamensis TaxID=289483 RepID=UPI0013914A98|nr:DUF5694 domain-containing protein [Pseudoxanthomonas kalamensis]KAF1708517.1 hypothetical protein CSC70_12770 [Pseudoxanthomonas kalamensis DSM 18571]